MANVVQQDYGKNSVSNLGHSFSDYMFTTRDSAPYEYYVRSLTSQDEALEVNLESFSIFVREISQNGACTVEGADGFRADLKIGDAIQSESSKLKIHVTQGECLLLIAGVAEGDPNQKPSLKITPYGDIKKVVKHWGYELWIPGEHPLYAFKEIYIKAGTKTSLQYHNFKQETNVLTQGEAYLHYQENQKVGIDDVTSNDITSVKLASISAIDVKPKTIHRLEAVTDVLLYEVSTPHLDDVIRLQDDLNRHDGRIHEEHA